MRTKIVIFLLFIMLITSFLVFLPVEIVIAKGNTLYVGGGGPGNYTSIQNAINDANSGDLIFVYSGIYYENVIVNKYNIKLIGEDKNTTTIDGRGSGDVVYISGGKVNLSGFTVRNSGSICYNAGIHIESDNNNVSGNKITINAEIGLWIHSCNDNYVSNNIIDKNGLDGLWLEDSRYNTVSNNFISSNTDHGIVIYSSTYNTLSENIISFNDDNGMSIFYPSNNNKIIKNIIRSNNDNGIYINATNNFIYHNSFIHNLENAVDEGGNSWDNAYPSGGNYWSDYTGDDDYHGLNQNLPGHDRIGDTPYEIPSEHGTDYYPLIDQDDWLNKVPENLTLNGQTYGNAGDEYYYYTSAKDPDGDPIYYKFDWGDDSYSEWFGPYISGTEASESHTWSVGIFDIRVKAKDTRGLETNWSDPFRITMPRNRMFTSSNFLQLFQRFLNIVPVLRFFLGAMKT